MEIVKYPHPALGWKSKPIQEINAVLRRAIRTMFDLMYESKGVGLAANQVAIPFRFFIVNVTGDPEERDEEFVFINPEITYRKGSAEGEEGCLSLPELFGPVRRAEQIVVEAFDLDGQPFEMQLEGLPARVIQHEADHLDGHVFIERMVDTARNEVADRISDFEADFRRQQKTQADLSTNAITQRLRKLEELGKLPDDFVTVAEAPAEST